MDEDDFFLILQSSWNPHVQRDTVCNVPYVSTPRKRFKVETSSKFTYARIKS